MDIKALMDLTYGMYVISTKYNDRKVGCFVNTVTQITAENPIITVSVNKQNYTNEAIKSTGKFAVSILSCQTKPEIIGKFGFVSSKNVDKFDSINYNIIDDLPVVDENICGYIICETIQVIDAETHDIFVARVVDCNKQSDLIPMTYKYYHDVIKGKAPKSAPTYIEEKEDIKPNSNIYKCIVCGHIYDETKEKIKFEDLPEDWTCPICGVGKEKFKKVEG